MRALLAALLLLQAAHAGRAACFSVVSSSHLLDLSNKSRDCPTLQWSEVDQKNVRTLNLSHNGIDSIDSINGTLGSQVLVLDLSHNRLQSLPDHFLAQAKGLKKLHLQHNQLQSLPDDFFHDNLNLNHLDLAHNPLAAVPTSAFHPTLQHMVVDCRCDVAQSVAAHCACESPNCTERTCHCLAEQGPRNLTDFHASTCRSWPGLVPTAVVGALVALLLLGVLGAFFLLRQRRRAAATGVLKKRESSSSGGHGQPRYISRTAEQTAAQDPHQAPDYENVFIGPMQLQPQAHLTPQHKGRERKKSPGRAPKATEEHYYLESDTGLGDNPIYANTPSPYNRGHPESCTDEDVYIVPDK
ncbi:leucine-rich repeat-containing protein 25 [Alligator sinensis]|uniref:Leucine-rich repeat-containing protein 25 n=1 Tax=Alligator sinensis TaxID=38654 RepID=A0A1U7RTC1_ALLSI|nr:leucine-rich repeat-containing protein 25 [Alligator sinensis]